MYEAEIFERKQNQQYYSPLEVCLQSIVLLLSIQHRSLNR